jgi:hypothetical protein
MANTLTLALFQPENPEVYPSRPEKERRTETRRYSLFADKVRFLCPYGQTPEEAERVY